MLNLGAQQVAHAGKLSPALQAKIHPSSRRKRNLIAGLPTSPAHLEPHIPSWEAGETVAGDRFSIRQRTRIFLANRVPAIPAKAAYLLLIRA